VGVSRSERWAVQLRLALYPFFAFGCIGVIGDHKVNTHDFQVGLLFCVVTRRQGFQFRFPRSGFTAPSRLRTSIAISAK
jgi:hypothetical protein